jgi:hypothetical protein
MRYVKHFVSFLVVSVPLAVSPRLWWRDYAIASVESCFIYDNGTSVTSFMPLGGAGVTKSIKRRQPIKLVQDWLRAAARSGACDQRVAQGPSEAHSKVETHRPEGHV